MTETPQRPSPPHPPAFRRTFQARLFLLGLALIANILIIAQLIDVVPGAILFAASVLLYTMLTYLFWKCPHCAAYPGNAVMPDYCEKCGKVIFGVDAHVPDRKPDTRLSGIPLRYILIGRGLYGVLVLLYFVLLAPQQSDQPVLFWIGALCMIGGGAWLEWRWWRCPKCGGYLRRSFWPGRACPKCSEPFHY